MFFSYKKSTTNSKKAYNETSDTNCNTSGYDEKPSSTFTMSRRCGRVRCTRFIRPIGGVIKSIKWRFECRLWFPRWRRASSVTSNCFTRMTTWADAAEGSSVSINIKYMTRVASSIPGRVWIMRRVDVTAAAAAATTTTAVASTASVNITSRRRSRRRKVHYI